MPDALFGSAVLCGKASQVINLKNQSNRHQAADIYGLDDLLVDLRDGKVKQGIGQMMSIHDHQFCHSGP